MMHTFYLLGAGASAGMVPLTRELKKTVVTRYRSFGMYPVERVEPDPVFERVIGDPTEGTDQITAALLRYLFPSAVHAMVLQQLSPPQNAPLADQYGLFLRAAKPSTFFNMNVDGLARRYCLGHYVLEPHGRIPPALVRSPRWDEVIDALLEFGFAAPQIPGVLLPQPEPITITSRAAYLAARPLFYAGRYFVIIGYSFGKSSQHDTFDDIETFEFFRELLRSTGKTVLVLSPEPGFVGFLCREAMRRSSVHELAVYWDHLSAAVSCVFRDSGLTDFASLSDMTSEVLYQYDRLCDK
ncbi:MAG: hypothetical protein NT178_18735 [Proteobacteria bacterium]|nr:hypothetical protein [Pseudomonadota bacterium]